jgi:4-amino-4-deoxy-L-arabinose transferase-like glycosyltransferase
VTETTSTSRTDRLLALALGLATVFLLWGTQRPVGYVRDEGYYFTAAHDYEGWFVELGRDFKRGQFLTPFRDATIVQYWHYNNEHPVLAKTLFALSHLTLHEWLRWLDDATAYRFPAFLFGGLASWALFWLARPGGRLGAVLAPMLFWAVPRHFFHGHLAAFDMPVVATWCLFFLLYAKSIETGQGGWKAGIAFGLALATKHNAFFLPIVVVLHWLLTDWRGIREAGWRGFFGRIPNAMWAMALLGPVVLYFHWPYLWHHPIDRVNEWLSFHAHHVHYAWQYLGHVLRAPPFPVEYPLMLEALTVPAATLVLLTLAALWMGIRCAASLIPSLQRIADAATSRDWLLLLGVIVALAPFMTQSVPIFGGVKHWMSAPALAAVFGGQLLVLLGRQLAPSRAALVSGVLAVLVLVPGAWATAHFHPFGTSAYNEIAGGASGGAALGMQRQYWSNNVTAVLPWINEHAPKNARIFFHEVNQDSFFAYQQNGWLRKDLRYEWQNPAVAAISVWQYHQEFRDKEFEIWNEYGTRTPLLDFTIDEAPQIVVYARPGGAL